MKNLFDKYALTVLGAVGLGAAVQSCSPADGNNPGSEYMPDMFHSIAYEANLDDYYFLNTWGDHKDYYQIAEPREPVAGTIPFGEFGLQEGAYSPEMENQVMNIEPNGYVPFHFENSEEGRLDASVSLLKNPLPITEEALSSGKSLYTIYCATCHGDKADGLGYLVRDDGGVYPVAPANLIDAKFVDTTVGTLYYAIEYGKNAMGSYADKLSYKERWNVIHYIRSLQSKEAELVYSPVKNTFKPMEAMTAKEWDNMEMDDKMASGDHEMKVEDEMEHSTETSGSHDSH